MDHNRKVTSTIAVRNDSLVKNLIPIGAVLGRPLADPMKDDVSSRSDSPPTTDAVQRGATFTVRLWLHQTTVIVLASQMYYSVPLYRSDVL